MAGAIGSFVVRGKSMDHDFIEVINGQHYIPILGDLLPKLWGDLRTIKRTRFLLRTDAGVLEVEESEYRQTEIGQRIQADPDRLH